MRHLIIFLSIALLGNAGAAVSGLYTYTVNADNASVTITDYPTTETGALVIVDTLGGYPVTSIGGNAFSNCSSLTSVTIPDSVTSIGFIAFMNCSSLTSVTIPNSVTSLADGAFQNCSSLTSVIIPDSVTSLGSYAFYDCTSLTIIIIGNSVTSIGSQAFVATNLTYSLVDGVKYLFSDSYAFLIDGSSASGDLSLPSDVGGKPIRVIADRAFYNSGLTSITIPDSVTSIGYGAFSNCAGLSNVTIGNSVTSIGQQAFAYCTNLASILFESMAAPTIGSNAFASISNTAIIQYPSGATGYAASYDGVPTEEEEPEFLYSYSINPDNVSVTITDYPTDATGEISIPDTIDGRSVTTIGSNAFYNCSSLTSINIPDSVTSIGTSAFFNCTSLTSIIIPDSVTSMGDNIFGSCTVLAEINCLATTAPTLGGNAFGSVAASDIHVPVGATGYGTTYGGLTVVADL